MSTAGHIVTTTATAAIGTCLVASSTLYAKDFKIDTVIPNLNVEDYHSDDASDELWMQAASNGSTIGEDGETQTNETLRLRQSSAELNIVSGATVTVARLLGGDEGKTTVLNIETGATLNVEGSDGSGSPLAGAALVLSHWSTGGTININGTLNIHNATISSHDGNGTININDGGILNVKELNPRTNGGAVTATVNLTSGGTLNIGADGIANSSKLNLSLSGGTIGIDGANGATGWKAEKALVLSGNVTFDTTVANAAGSSPAGSITLSAVDTAGHTLTVSGNGTLQVNTLTAGAAGSQVTVNSSSTLQLAGPLSISDGASLTITNNGALNYSGAANFSDANSNGFQSTYAQLVDSNKAGSLTIEGSGSLTLRGTQATYDSQTGRLTSTTSNVYYVATGDVSLSEIRTAATNENISDPSIYVKQGATLNIDGGEISADGDIAGNKVTLEGGSGLVLSGTTVVNELPSILAGGAINMTIAEDANATWTPSIESGIGSLTLNNGSKLTLSGSVNNINTEVTLNSATLVINGANGNLGNDSTSPLRLNGTSRIQLAEGTSCIFGRIETEQDADATISGGTMVMNTGRTIETKANSTLSISSNVNISAALTKDGAGTLSFAKGATIGATLTVQAGEVVLEGDGNNLQGVTLAAGKLTTKGNTTINGIFDISKGGSYKGVLEVAGGTTSIAGDQKWLGNGVGAAIRVLAEEDATLEMLDLAIRAKDSAPAVITSSGDIWMSNTSVGITALEADIQTSKLEEFSWALDSSRLSNTGDQNLAYNGTATNSTFVNASTGTTKVVKGTANVTLAGNGATATGVNTGTDNAVSAATITTVTGTASTFAGSVTVTDSLTAAALDTSASFIVTSGGADGSAPALFGKDSNTAIKSTFQSTGGTLTLGDGATLTLGGALAASDNNTFTLTLNGKITLDFTSEVKAAIAELSMGSTLDILLATNVNFGSTDGTSLLSDNAADYLTLASGSGLELTDASQLILSDNNLILTNAAVAIPEPATATLSLLALAALCARRRRKA